MLENLPLEDLESGEMPTPEEDESNDEDGMLEQMMTCLGTFMRSLCIHKTQIKQVVTI